MATAKILSNYDNGDQLIELPDGFQLNGSSVLVTRDPATGGVLLSALPTASKEHNDAQDATDKR